MARVDKPGATEPLPPETGPRFSPGTGLDNRAVTDAEYATPLRRGLTRRKFLALMGSSLIGGGGALWALRRENPDTLANPASPTQVSTPNSLSAEEALGLTVQEALPPEYWERAQEIDRIIKQTILNAEQGSANVYDQTLEGLRGIFIDTVQHNGREVIIKMYNPHIVELPIDSSEHDSVIAFSAWHTPSNTFVYSVCGVATGNIYSYDPTGYELWGVKLPDGSEDQHTPGIGATRPVSLNQTGATVLDITGWEARGQFAGLQASDMPLHATAHLFENRADALTDASQVYSLRHEQERNRIFKDKYAVRDFRETNGTQP